MVKHFPAFWRSGSALLAFLSSLVDGQGMGPLSDCFFCCPRGPGLPRAEPHRHEPFPGVDWRCGIHPLAHAGEASQLSWNGVSLASPGTALGSSKANPGLWQWLRTIFLLHSCLKSNSLEALLLERCFARLLYICEEKCLWRASDFSLLSFLPPFSPGV